MICASHRLWSGDQVKENAVAGSLLHVWKRRERCKGFRWRNLKERDHFEVVKLVWMIILKCKEV
jgi:hypothetical protein